jgi:hypothetical protein
MSIVAPLLAFATVITTLTAAALFAWNLAEWLSELSIGRR